MALFMLDTSLQPVVFPRWFVIFLKLYHARLQTVQVEKFKKGDFGKCPRVLCNQQHLLPMGLSDIPGVRSVKLYCARCEDVYNPKSSRHAAIDGAYFGCSFHNILFQVYPSLVPDKSRARYEPRVFGFRVHAAAALSRWQDRRRDEMKKRLEDLDIDASFIEDFEETDDEYDDDEVPGDAGFGNALSKGKGSKMDLGI